MLVETMLANYETLLASATGLYSIAVVGQLLRYAVIEAKYRRAGKHLPAESSGGLFLHPYYSKRSTQGTLWKTGTNLDPPRSRGVKSREPIIRCCRRWHFMTPGANPYKPGLGKREVALIAGLAAPTRL